MNKNHDVLISGAYGEFNIGDDVLLYIILMWLECNNFKSNISITSSNKLYIKKLYPKVNIISKSSASLLDPKLFILGGGTQYYSFKNPNQLNSKYNFLNKLKYLIKLFLLYFKYVYCYFHKIYSSKIKIALGIGLGPFEVPYSQLITRSKLFEFNYLYVRDVYSNNYCNKYKLPHFLGADICLSDYFYNKFNFKHINDISSKENVGIVLRCWDHNENGNILNEKIFNWINLNNEKFKITLFIFSQENDSSLKEISIDIKNIKVEIWNPEKDTFENYLYKISLMDFMITSRYHAAIFNLNFNIPTICLGIEPKLKLIAEEVEGYYYFNISDDLIKLNAYINEILNTYSNLKGKIELSRIKLNQRANLLLKLAEKYLN